MYDCLFSIIVLRNTKNIEMIKEAAMKKDLFQKKVIVAGSGKSGIGAVKLLVQAGADVILYDGNENLSEQEIKEKLPITMQNEIEIVIGSLTDEICKDVKLMVTSPGIAIDAPCVEKARARNIKIWGEIELAFQFAKGKIAAITGTNGKTTTTALVGAILKEYYKSVFVVGNIGNPYTEEALNTTQESYTVAEISSFQLESIEEFAPEVSAILNITPDHLNRHKTMENYIKIKEKITKNQKKDSICVLNYEDEELRRFGETLSLSVLFFSSKRTLKKGVFLEGEEIIYETGEERKKICKISELHLVGIHNVENVMAAVAISFALGVPIKQIQKSVKNFKAVEHRIEFVREKNQVVYYNDSKGTNPDASIQAIKAMSRPTILIAGGYDKNSEYEEYIKAFDGKVRLLVGIGETKYKIAEKAKEMGFFEIIFADTLKEAVEICAKQAHSGDAVLLSPACASWDMFKSYEERGCLFKEYVNCL